MHYIWGHCVYKMFTKKDRDTDHRFQLLRNRHWFCWVNIEKTNLKMHMEVFIGEMISRTSQTFTTNQLRK